MNIFRNFIYRSYDTNKININDYNSPDDYDEWLDGEIEKYSQIDFIIGLEKEIDLFIKEENNIDFSFNTRKASFLNNILYGTYIISYMKEIESEEVKKKLIKIFDYIEYNYVDSNKLALSSLRDYRKEQGI